MANLNPFVEVNYKEKLVTDEGSHAGFKLELDVIAATEFVAKKRARAYIVRNYHVAPGGITFDAVDMVSDGYTIMEKIAGPTPVATYRVDAMT